MICSDAACGSDLTQAASSRPAMSVMRRSAAGFSDRARRTARYRRAWSSASSMGQISNDAEAVRGDRCRTKCSGTQLMRMARGGAIPTRSEGFEEAFLLEAVAEDREDLEVARRGSGSCGSMRWPKQQGIARAEQMKQVGGAPGVFGTPSAAEITGPDKALAFLASQATVEEIEDADEDSRTSRSVEDRDEKRRRGRDERARRGAWRGLPRSAMSSL